MSPDFAVDTGRRLRSESLRAVYHASHKNKPSCLHRAIAAASYCASLTVAAAQQIFIVIRTYYTQSNAPLERSAEDLIRRMTLVQRRVSCFRLPADCSNALSRN
jgi:hypothetical protein